MIDRMNGNLFQWLRGFYYVVTLGSTSAAAAAMGLSQPSVSHQVHMLEAELGVQLFQRTLRRMAPTKEGLVLYERTVTLFEQVRGIKAEIGCPDQGDLKGEVSLATTHSVAGNYLPALLADFKRLHPKVFFAVSGVTESRQILERVQSAAVELGIVHGQNFPDPIEAIPIFTSPLVLIVARRFAAEKGWRFSRAADGSLADLRELHQIPYVAFSPDTLLSHYLYEILARHQIEVTVTARVNTSILLVKFVKMGFGVTILDAFTAAAEPDVFDCYPIPAVAAPQTYHLIHRRKSYLSPQGLALLEYLRERRLSTAGLELVAAEDRAPLSA